jgi:uncharacterized protein (TIGR03067 family)
MRRLQWALALLVITLAPTSLPAVADRPAKTKKTDPAREELKRLEGTWVLKMGPRGPRGSYRRATIRDGTWRVTDRQGKLRVAAVMTVDPTKNPKWVTLRFTFGPSRGQTLPGIYELKGDTLHFYVPGSGVRPKAFPATGYPGSFFLRQKQSK